MYWAVCLRYEAHELFYAALSYLSSLKTIAPGFQKSKKRQHDSMFRLSDSYEFWFRVVYVCYVLKVYCTAFLGI